MGVIVAFDMTVNVEKEIANRMQQEAIIKLQMENNSALKKSIDLKDEFLSLISHEFKTPLAVINSAIQMLDVFCKNEVSDRAKGYIDKIRQNSARQLKLVNNLLDITRISAGMLNVNWINLDIVMLTKSIIESIGVYAEHKNIKLTFSSELNEKIIGIDEEKYERIILNLLSNAIKYTPGGKSIDVVVSQKVIENMPIISIKVSDKGIGIPAEKLSLIFERFGQVDSSLSRQAEGTGIGLYITKMFAKMLGGNISVESGVNYGSTFTVFLPDTTVKINNMDKVTRDLSDKQLRYSTVIEFSDIYIK